VSQETLFPEANIKAKGLLPDGFRYQEEFLEAAEEVELVSMIERLEFKPFEFHGYVGNRRVVSFGFRYDYSRRVVLTAEEIPSWIGELRRKIAAFAGRAPEDFKQVGINEYAEGAGIGWHRDKPEFGDVVGVSLLSKATLRLRRETGKTWRRASQILEPRSIYLLRGEVREIWEHSIPPARALRYAVMFRTLVNRGSAQE
jgi:alkylated DNA repair dioxygenase AlkB